MQWTRPYVRLGLACWREIRGVVLRPRTLPWLSDGVRCGDAGAKGGAERHSRRRGRRDLGERHRARGRRERQHLRADRQRNVQCSDGRARLWRLSAEACGGWFVAGDPRLLHSVRASSPKQYGRRSGLERPDTFAGPAWATSSPAAATHEGARRST
jgi:hypothetical protein